MGNLYAAGVRGVFLFSTPLARDADQLFAQGRVNLGCGFHFESPYTVRVAAGARPPFPRSCFHWAFVTRVRFTMSQYVPSRKLVVGPGHRTL